MPRRSVRSPCDDATLACIAICFLAACGGRDRPAPLPLGSAPAGDGANVGSCERDADCIVLVGTVCDPCSACKGARPRALPVAALAQEHEVCDGDAATRECAPCPPPPDDWIERKAVCTNATCALEPPLGFH